MDPRPMEVLESVQKGAWIAKLETWHNVSLITVKATFDKMARKLPEDSRLPKRYLYTLFDGTIIVTKNNPLPENVRRAFGGEIVHSEEYVPSRDPVDPWKNVPRIVATGTVNSSQTQPNREPTHG